MAEPLAGLFVTFEGVEGAGKTTQIALLRDALLRPGQSGARASAGVRTETVLAVLGREVIVTREPGGDVVAETVRRLLLEQEMTPRAELLLFLAARAQNVEEVIRPHLDGGGVVLCDRFIDSSVAYQGYGRGLGRDLVAQLNAVAVAGVVPDLTVLLDLDPEIGLARQTNRNRMEAENLAFHHRVRQGFLLESQNSPARFCVLDATQDPGLLHAAIWERVQKLLADRPG
jgi:dTMP kinase